MRLFVAVACLLLTGCHALMPIGAPPEDGAPPKDGAPDGELGAIDQRTGEDLQASQERGHRPPACTRVWKCSNKPFTQLECRASCETENETYEIECAEGSGYSECTCRTSDALGHCQKGGSGCDVCFQVALSLQSCCP